MVISLVGSRVIAVTLEQKNLIVDNNLNTLDSQKEDLSGISELGTLDTNAPASLSILNDNNSFTSNFIDETVNNQSQNINNESVLSTPKIPDIPVNSDTSTQTLNEPIIDVSASNKPNNNIDLAELSKCEEVLENSLTAIQMALDTINKIKNQDSNQNILNKVA